MATKGDEEVVNYEFRINAYVLLNVKQGNRDLPQGTGNCTQHLITTYHGEESEKENTYNIYITLLYILNTTS